MNKDLLLALIFHRQGVQLEEPDDHILQLYIEDQLIATFSQTGVTLDNILKEIRAYDRRN